MIINIIIFIFLAAGLGIICYLEGFARGVISGIKFCKDDLKEVNSLDESLVNRKYWNRYWWRCTNCANLNHVTSIKCDFCFCKK